MINTTVAFIKWHLTLSKVVLDVCGWNLSSYLLLIDKWEKCVIHIKSWIALLIYATLFVFFFHKLNTSFELMNNLGAKEVFA